MSHVIVKDEGDDFNTVYQIRATISTRSELQELIDKLTRHLPDLEPQRKDHDRRTDEPVHTSPALPAPAGTGREAAPFGKEDGFTRAFRGD